MPIPRNDWYTIKSGDTLSKIAREAGVSDWKIIYTDPQNAEFRKKRPDPDKIFPGDRIWIPGALKTSTGKKTVFVAPAEKIQVIEIFFESQVDVYYVRLALSQTEYITNSIPVNPGFLHFNPPKIFPEASKPHWILDPATLKPLESWPAVLIRDGSNSAKSANRDILVSFSAGTSFDGDRIIKAESRSGEFVIGEQTVKFKRGDATKALFTFTKVPTTVGKFKDVVLAWSVKKSASDSFKEICRTQHTFYVIDEKPLKANLRRVDMNIFEVIDWSCTWAHGTSGLNSIIAAIWKEFSPVKAVHSTGFEYWKNWNNPIYKVQPYQTIDFAIKGRDDPDPLSRNSVSCAVFDNIFINALTLHGIKAAEIMIRPSNKSQSIFKSNGKRYKCIAFNGTSVKGQGNFNAPPTWQNHWIANINDSSSQWKLYDSSYGPPPCNSTDPYLKPVDVLNYEKIGVKNFVCINLDDSISENLPAGTLPDEPPHLQGDVLWKP